MITDAAIRYPDGTIYKASRHAYCIKEAADSGLHDRREKFEQGFMFYIIGPGGREVFISRDEARDWAVSNGLIADNHGQLYSEDLWPTICPRCKGHVGFYEKYVEVRTYFYSFKNEGQGEADDADIIKGGKRKHCQECDADITRTVNKGVFGVA